MTRSMVQAGWLLGVLLPLAGPAAAASVAEAVRIVDRAEPLRCELLAAEQRLIQAVAGSEEHAEALADRDEMLERMRAHVLAAWPEYVAAMRRLTAEQKEQVYRHASGMTQRCAAKSCAGAPCPPREAKAPGAERAARAAGSLRGRRAPTARP